MNSAIPFSVLLVTATALPAQSTGTLKTATPVSVFARTGTTLNFAVAKKDTIIKVLTVSARTTGAEATTSTSITDSRNGLCNGNGMHGGGMHGRGMRNHRMRNHRMRNHRMHGNGMCSGPGMGHMHVHIDEMGSSSARGSSSGTSASLSAGNLKPGPHSFQYSVKASKGAKGTLHVTWMGMATGNGAVRVAIDVDGDAKPDFSASQKDMMLQRSMSVTAGAAGFVFMITTEGSVSGSAMMMGQASYGGCVNLAFEEQKGNDDDPGAAGCGPELCGSIAQTSGGRLLELRLTKAAPSSLGVTVIGNRRMSTAIPGSYCLLGTNLLSYLLFQTDGKGGATQRFTLSKAWQPSGFIQDVVVDILSPRLEIKTSNLLRLQ
ncbi:MAG: hypothetical protein ACE5F1_16930 [Planctomycetota bacterium]